MKVYFDNICLRSPYEMQRAKMELNFFFLNSVPDTSIKNGKHVFLQWNCSAQRNYVQRILSRRVF